MLWKITSSDYIEQHLNRCVQIGWLHSICLLSEWFSLINRPPDRELVFVFKCVKGCRSGFNFLSLIVFGSNFCQHKQHVLHIVKITNESQSEVCSRTQTKLFVHGYLCSIFMFEAVCQSLSSLILQDCTHMIFYFGYYLHILQWSPGRKYFMLCFWLLSKTIQHNRQLMIGFTVLP